MDGDVVHELAVEASVGLVGALVQARAMLAVAPCGGRAGHRHLHLDAVRRGGVDDRVVGVPVVDHLGRSRALRVLRGGDAVPQHVHAQTRDPELLGLLEPKVAVVIALIEKDGVVLEANLHAARCVGAAGGGAE